MATLVEKIVVGSSPTPGNPFFTREIYLINPDGTDPQRLTDNAFGDAGGPLSPDGKEIVFGSNRFTADPLDPLTWNIADLFVMDADGTKQTLLTRGSSATWSPDGKDIAFHASASYYESGGTDTTALPIRPDPGAPTLDSDIFVAKVNELADAEDVLTKTQLATNITNTPDQIEEDADWSASTPTAPDGLIVFTSHPVTDLGLPPPNTSNYVTKEIYVMNPDGSGRHPLTDNLYEERAPSWSPDGTQIAFMARVGGNDFEICVMNADGSGFQQLTNNTLFDASPNWSPDGTKIIWQQGPATQPTITIMDLDTMELLPVQFPPGFGGTNWGVVKTRGGSDGADETFFAGSQADYSIQNLGRGLPDQLPAVQVELPNDTATEHIAAAAETIEDHIPDWFALGSVQTARALDHPPSEIPPPPPVTPSLPDEALSVLGGLPETAHIPDWLIV
jgi:dipeptidyl aminopeptidase/acylaminoacyl peptidase